MACSEFVKGLAQLRSQLRHGRHFRQRNGTQGHTVGARLLSHGFFCSPSIHRLQDRVTVGLEVFRHDIIPDAAMARLEPAEHGISDS